MTSYRISSLPLRSGEEYLLQACITTVMAWTVFACNEALRAT